MDITLIISIVALLLSIFAVFRVMASNSMLSARIERLRDKNSILENRLNDYNGNVNRSAGNRNSRQPNAPKEPNPQRQQRPPRDQQQPKEQRPPKEQRQPREQQTQQRPPREPQQGQQNQQRPPREQQQGQQQPQQQRQQQGQQQQPTQQQQQQTGQQQQPKKKRENQRRGEPMEKRYTDPEQPRNEEPSLEELVAASAHEEPAFETQEPTPQPVQPVDEMPDKKYAIIPEDGIIRQHQLQLQPDSDSYLEVDMPSYNKSSVTRYRFNLSGNHAFVIAQGIDRLENAFSFVKPSNRKVSQVVLQQDGVLARVENGWKIQEKAKIDFR